MLAQQFRPQKSISWYDPETNKKRKGVIIGYVSRDVVFARFAGVTHTHYIVSVGKDINGNDIELEVNIDDPTVEQLD